MKSYLNLSFLFLPLFLHAQTQPPGFGETRILDDFSEISGWVSGQSDGVTASLSRGSQSLVLSYDLSKAKGYAFTSKPFDLELPSDYELTFSLSGTPVTNTIEFKLIDEFGNTWWRPFTGFKVSSEPKTLSVKSKDVSYAWGPKAVAELKRLSRIEIVMTSLEGGKGDLLISDLKLTNLGYAKTDFKSVVSGKELDSETGKSLTDGSLATGWLITESGKKSVSLKFLQIQKVAGLEIRQTGSPLKKVKVYLLNGKKEKLVFSDETGVWDGRIIRWNPVSADGLKLEAELEKGTELKEVIPVGDEDVFLVDGTGSSKISDGQLKTGNSLSSGQILLTFKRPTSVGALQLFWGKKFPADYSVELSDDRIHFSQVFTRTRGNGGKDEVIFQDARPSVIRIKWNSPKIVDLKEILVSGSEAAGDANKQFTALAKDSKRGEYPRFFTGEMSYWTVSGVDGDQREALFNEDGAFEVGMENLSLEPFLRLGKERITWADVKPVQSLEQGYFPIPSVTWTGKPVELSTELLSVGTAGNTGQLVRYRMVNTSKKIQNGELVVAFRPFQVNPPWQNVNRLVEGGLARIHSGKWENSKWILNDSVSILPVSKPAQTGITRFRDADIAGMVQSGKFPTEKEMKDPDGLLSGGLIYPFSLKPDESTEVIVSVPWSAEKEKEFRDGAANPSEFYSKQKSKLISSWSEKLNRTSFLVPPAGEKMLNTFRSYLAYIFINRDGPRIQPGSRSYLRSWIRDGSMTSAGLLQTGNPKEVKAFLDWFTPNVFPSGRVPCVVDQRGADAVPENDSNGELLYAFAHYFQYTGDTAFVKKHWPILVRAADYIITMRNERKTPAYEGTRYFGLVPESISHEGYSAKAMHSHWDNFFSLKGLKDASFLADVLGDKTLAEKYKTESVDYRKDILASIAKTQSEMGIAYIPGCAELGDFDATSTSIALYPGDEKDELKSTGLQATFDRYSEFVDSRLLPTSTWNDYTPYEIRNTHSFILLGQKERAFKTFDFLFKDQRPQAWNQWAEIVWRNEREGRWIGDMPHTWIGSDYLHAFRSMFVFENESKKELVLAAGIPDDWLNSPFPIGIENAFTLFGNVSWEAEKVSNGIEIRVDGNLKPGTRLIVKSPLSKDLKAVLVNGKPWEDWTEREVRLPAGTWRILLKY
ncbi:MAG: hypothetical protein LCH54_08710 [Bacteroidetes bacterium]|nr:hypothetical protein [Bacteroidota bacterium]